MEADESCALKRNHPRSRVLVLVRWHNRREEGVAAELCDVSAEGVFLVPTGALPDQVDVGDPVWVVVPAADGEKTLTGIVRWRGFHPSHELIGCGIKLDPSSHDVVRSLFPFVRSPRRLRNRACTRVSPPRVRARLRNLGTRRTLHPKEGPPWLRSLSILLSTME